MTPTVESAYCSLDLGTIDASRWWKKVLNPSRDKNSRHTPRTGEGGEEPTSFVCDPGSELRLQ